MAVHAHAQLIEHTVTVILPTRPGAVSVRPPESAAETRNALTWAVIVRIHALASWSGSGEVASHSQGPSASAPRKLDVRRLRPS